MSEGLHGYRGTALRMLMEAGAEVGDLVRVVEDNVVFEGILLPRSEYSDDKHIVIKSKSGYNLSLIHI